MKPVLSRLLSVVLAVLLLGLLGACSDFDEMKSQKLYDQAQRLSAEGQNDSAEALLVELLASYPRTRMAPVADRQLKQLRHRREMLERQEFAKILDSCRQVMNGYYSIYAIYPASIEEFDASGYFFDSEYLAEIAGLEGFQLYLVLTGDEMGFRAWGVKADRERGYAINGGTRGMTPFDRDETVRALQEQYRLVEQKGNLLILAPRS